MQHSLIAEAVEELTNMATDCSAGLSPSDLLALKARAISHGAEIHDDIDTETQEGREVITASAATILGLTIIICERMRRDYEKKQKDAERN